MGIGRLPTGLSETILKYHLAGGLLSFDQKKFEV